MKSSMTGSRGPDSDTWRLQLPDHRKTLQFMQGHVKVINTVPDRDPNTRVGSQLPDPNECNSTLTSETKGET